MKQPNIGFFTEENSIETVKSRHKDCDNPRLKKIMDVMTYSTIDQMMILLQLEMQ